MNKEWPLWVCDHRQDKIKNEVIPDKVGVTPIELKMHESRLRWFVHINKKAPNAIVRRWERLITKGFQRRKG